MFGGIGPYAVLAPKTAAVFAGQNLDNLATLSQAMQILQAELVCSHPPAAAPATYRISLACGLLYKFYLSLLPNANPRVQSAAIPFVRPISSGSSKFTTNPSEYPVSQPMPKLSALLQTSGQAHYTDDLPILRKTLFAAFALSTVAAATLADIDLSSALAAPGTYVSMQFDIGFFPPNSRGCFDSAFLGVSRVLTAADLPGLNSFAMPGSVS